jgi:hypothetical protein
MSEQQSQRFRIFATIFSLVAAAAHLGWELTHGGVVSHHILNMSDMPAISNWWGLLLLPVLTWLLVGRISKRLALNSETTTLQNKLMMGAASGLLGALTAGILLSLAFTLGNEDMAFYVLIGILLMALVVRVCREEYLLGFVYGMFVTFGVVLPIGIGLIIAAISAFVHLGVRPLAMKFWHRVQPST